MLRVCVAGVLVAFGATAWTDGAGQKGSYYLEAGRSHAAGQCATGMVFRQQHTGEPVHDQAMAGRHQGGPGRVEARRHEPEQTRRYSRYRYGWPSYGYGYGWPYSYNYAPYYYTFYPYSGVWPYCGYWPYSIYSYPRWRPMFWPYYRPHYYGLIRPLPIVVTNMPVVIGGYCGAGFGVHIGYSWSW